MIYETAPAKINLTLDTLYKREDGYHEVEMIMTTIDLNDRLTFECRDDGEIIIDVEHNFVPSDHRNLAYKAAKLMQDRYNIEKGVKISLEKSIPISAGLAGGSSDAAATFRGLNELWGINESLETLSELASEIGSDISFCIYGKTALCQGRGEKITHLPKPPSAWVVIAKPDIGVSTPEIYGALDLENKDEVQTQACLKAIENNDYATMCQSLGNSLEKVTMQLYPEVEKLKNTMSNTGVDAALMSGSGPTIYGFVQKERQAKQVYNALMGCCNDVYIARLLG
ncbi:MULTISPECIES: 4-(cytidine 5'-diphospho)-2-C-methyl-D-erythritol kinase [Mammaliicoccus]|jgi:4-diphosphocytidyl-2-C-methyl-D-erythritol kinase|uniref:4-(cytidine 5'-diphospho)-2-C-methyl-D-erythritol kinase n=1 Tax=Mammaliicoccus TaxID=2803850 RepID=UPI00194EE483|nr:MULTISPECIES: 4-(cytidine 5'-diphospho)-2-C-methyl-D-erythritol kinase [Mammaliicoccus]MCD8797634.1 4-(cytidine 5'-diphospho)-2-C-methyl-D-erythritol kinase [Mammaliicoccus sciuri]MCD8810269.1 4-(cytidine 5'-diphospho)-2-C-methyl-D-erythritol kinase [Mammaliicoccus sciuri]MCD8819066.1 4-(cytidine 5'-diphospho)-2-C-methyl-D-erythritol kinase [Mammaliicoccus sciuri]MEB6340509.1 4-(cytidine 5'-diphospho)-2-C-methyl-D-erythritol kinase [Mammaliicoccus sciuri]MEB7402046.1 4-(cytidine 5'-diphosph